VCLIVEIEAIGDELLELDFGRSVEAGTIAIAATAAGTPIATVTARAITATIAAPVTTPVTTGSAGTAASTTGRTALTRRAISLAALLLRFRLFFCHLS
jgi:hypothetical protein